MFIENRERIRFRPEGILARIRLDSERDGGIELDGLVADMSYGGMKIRLNQPCDRFVQDAELQMTLFLPDAGAPAPIRGKIRHISGLGQCGLQYTAPHTEGELDDLLFECVKYAPHTAQA